MSGANSWLVRQRKSDLVELAETLGLKDYESLRKSELESQIDEYLSERTGQYQSDPKLSGYYTSRARTAGSPVKKEAPELKLSKRRATKAADEIVAVDDDAPATSNALIARTPARALSLASRIPLPPTPADVASSIESGTLAVRERVTELYQDSGITEAAAATRETLSTVHSVLLAIATFELYFLRPELLPDRYAFTIPAVALLRTRDIPVYLPDVFALLTASFWKPAATWLATSVLVPALFGYFFNLGVAHQGSSGRGRRSAAAKEAEYTVDPLMFSVVKAVLSYVVYAQGVGFGWVDEDTISRIEKSVYSGWRGVLTGTAIAGLTAVYDAVLRK